MMSIVLALLFSVQLSIISASDPLQDTKGCEGYHVSYHDNLNDKLFFINGQVVDNNIFCKALRINHAKCCLITGNAVCRHCGFNLLLDELPLRAGRKLLHVEVREGSIEHNLNTETPRGKNKDGHNSRFTPKVFAMAVPAVFIFCCVLLCPCFHARRKGTEHTVLSKDPVSYDSASPLEKNSLPENIPGSPLRVPPSPSRFSMSPKLSRAGSVHLSVSEVARATHNFSPSLVLGEGGFGTVYKAQLPDGQVVAIKRARKEHFEALRTEFRTEVELLAKIEHRNLVKLLGYVDKGNERLVITEYVPNGTLREHLDGLRGKLLDFNERLEISIDVAHALTYLHLYAEKQIIHRDVKSSNILLTESMRAKVADFGFARLGDSESDKTHVSTKVKGTVGYLDPEYMRTYKLTPKSDVYSFGILLLEILTGRRPVEMKRPADERVTVRWVFRKFSEGKVKEMLDPAMTEAIDGEILQKMFGLAIQCAAPTRTHRPDMKVVGEHLWAIRMDYLRSGRTE